MVNKYLFAAYAIVWLIFMLYAWNLTRRQGRLKKELDELKSKVEESVTASQESGS